MARLCFDVGMEINDVDREARHDYRLFMADQDRPDVDFEGEYGEIEDPDYTPPLPIEDDEPLVLETCGECLEETETTRGGLCPRCFDWATR